MHLIVVVANERTTVHCLLLHLTSFTCAFSGEVFKFIAGNI